MPIQQILSSLNSTVIYDVDATAFFTAASITDDTQKKAVNQLVLDLKTASIWTKMSTIYPFVGGTSSTHSYNLKNPATFQITWTGTVTHNANGITGDGSTGHGNLNLNPSTQLTNNNTHIGLYCRTTGANEAKSDIGSLASSSERFQLNIRYLNVFNGWQNGGTADSITPSSTDAQGFYIITRRSSTDLEGYKNGSSIGTRSTATGGLMPNAAMFICAVDYPGNGGPTERTTRNYAFASVGSSLTGGDAAAFSTAVAAFQTTLGRNV